MSLVKGVFAQLA